MAETGGLAVIDFETNDTSQFTSIVQAGSGTLTVADTYKNTSEGGGGTYGVEVEIVTGGASRAFGKKGFTTATSLYARCYVRLSSAWAGSNYNSGYFMRFNDGTETFAGRGLQVGFDQTTGGVPYRWAWILADGTELSSTTNFSLDAWHRVEIHYVQDASVGGGEVWVDGTLIGSTLTKNTSAVEVDNLFAGYMLLMDSNAVGYFYMDDIKIDTSAIGAYSAGGGASAVPAMMAHNE